MRIAFDTNILVYAAGAGDLHKKSIAMDCLAAASRHEAFVPLQTLGEFYRVLRRKFKLSAHEAASLVSLHRDSLTCLLTTTESFDHALELSEFHQFDIWDAIILSAAAQANCDVLLSEDGHSGFKWRGTVIADPFAADPHPLAVQLLAGR